MGNSDAVIAGRNFIVYSKAHAMANDLPADTVDYGAAWTGYTDRGYTTGGLGFSMGVQRNEIRVDQEFDPVQTPISQRSIKMTTSFAETTADNLQAAGGLGEVDPVAASSGVRGHNDLVINNSLADVYNSWGFDIEKPDGEALRFLIYKGLATGNPQPKFSPDNPAATDLEVTALVDTSTSPSRIAIVRDVIAALP